MTAAQPRGLAWALRRHDDAEGIAERFRAKHGPQIAAHQARLDAGWGDRVLRAVDEVCAAESDEPAPPLTVFVFANRSIGAGAGFSWRSAARRGFDWLLENLCDPEVAVDGWGAELEDLDPEARVREERAGWTRVVLQAETTEALLRAASLVFEGGGEVLEQLRAELEAWPASGNGYQMQADPVAVAHNALLDEARSLLAAMAEDPERLRSAVRALRAR